MKNGLISRLKNFALISPLLFLLHTNPIQAQSNQTKWQSLCDEISLRLEGNVDVTAGYGNFGKYASEDLIPYDNWEKNFLPPSPGMRLEQENLVNGMGSIDVGLAGKLKIGRLAIGPFANFDMLSLMGEPIKRLNLSWWDPVKVEELVFSRGPSIGASLDLYLDEYSDHFINASFSVHNYSVKENFYKGVDVYGGRNYNEPLDSKEIENGLGWKISSAFYLRDGEDAKAYTGFGLFFEKDGENIFGTGLYLDFKIYGTTNN